VRRLLAFAALAVLLAGCSDSVPGSKKLTTPTPDKVVGTLPTTTPTGSAAAGKPLFVSAGCGTCHVFTPAGTTGTIGPNLDNLAAEARQAKRGTLAQFTEASIVDPSAYIAPGYQNQMPPDGGRPLKPQQIADLVAFLTQSS
jgi:cytochrome c551/c552